jgi:methionine sulfoxide reductase heme-binding subunit
MSPHVWWYLSRASGLVAMALALASVTTGLTISGRLSTSKLRLPWSNDLHRYLSGLTLAFLTLHISTLALDTYAPFSISAMLVPLAAPWRPVAVAFGIIALYTLVVIDLTSRFRAKISKRVWRAFHSLSLLVYITALTHAFMAGPDMAIPALRYAIVAIVTLDVILLVRRIATHRSKPDRPSRPVRTGAATPQVPEPAPASSV